MKILIAGHQGNGKTQIAQVIQMALNAYDKSQLPLIVELDMPEYRTADIPLYSEPYQIYTTNSVQKMSKAFVRSFNMVLHINPEHQERTVEFALNVIKQFK